MTIRKEEKKDISSLNNDFAFLSFLDIEKNRLQKLAILFETKIPQSTKRLKRQNLYQIQRERRSQLKEKLIGIVSQKNSFLQKNLQTFFDQIFL
ncbi:MAG: hypothetical protein OXB88_03960 [Bacteriovoracales bacterium]|nr:hypothetical protein [Bacteriovoracales bacterium]